MNIDELVSTLGEELVKPNNLIVKRRAIDLIVRLSDFTSLRNNTQMLDNLTSGVINMFANSENENDDLCLKMSCIEYMRNFFNDAEFRINAYQQLVPSVIEMGNRMLQRCIKNPLAANKILELFRYIVDKYAPMVLQMPGRTETATELIVQNCVENWTMYLTKVSNGKLDQLDQIDFDELYGDESIALNGVLRILIPIVLLLPIQDLPA